MYDELISRLRSEAVYLPEKFSKNAELLDVLMKAADAIEDLSKWYKIMAEAYEAEVTRRDWIPVTERLPKNGEYVLCFCRANIVCVLRRDKDGDWYENPTHVYMNGFVTHWIPIPEPPEKER